jgi:hypothetical protein
VSITVLADTEKCLDVYIQARALRKQSLNKI